MDTPAYYIQRIRTHIWVDVHSSGPPPWSRLSADWLRLTVVRDSSKVIGRWLKLHLFQKYKKLSIKGVWSVSEYKRKSPLLSRIKWEALLENPQLSPREPKNLPTGKCRRTPTPAPHGICQSTESKASLLPILINYCHKSGSLLLTNMHIGSDSKLPSYLQKQFK